MRWYAGWIGSDGARRRLVGRGRFLPRRREIRHVPRDRFAALAASGSVTLDTIVFDNTITRVGDVRSGRWIGRCRRLARPRLLRVRSEERP